LGNRKAINQIASLGSVTINRRDTGLNQYFNWTQSAINYESNGVLVQDGWISSAYNALNQPLWIWSWRTNSSGSSLHFGHDPLGRCVTRTNDASVSTYFYYDGWNLIQEGSSASSADRIYAHGNRVDEIVASCPVSLNQWAYHHYDARGHCILLTNASGGLQEQYDYDAFGKPYFYNSTAWTTLQPSSSWGNRFLFTGREWLKDIAVYDFRNRHYLPELGRFIQPDPKEFLAGDYNLYRYCHNDPVNKNDPMGLLSGFKEYELVKDGPIDNTHDGWEVRGVDGTQNKSGDAVHLEVDRSVSRVNRIGNTDRGADTKTTPSVGEKNATPTIHEQIDVRYAKGAGPFTQGKAASSEWQHSDDAVKGANDLRQQYANRVQGLSASAAVRLIQNGDQRGPKSTWTPPLNGSQGYEGKIFRESFSNWDAPLFHSPKGEPLSLHAPVDAQGEPVKWSQ
jgi:RHS repeat-associated protein